MKPIIIPIAVDIARFCKNKVDKRFFERFQSNTNRAVQLATRAWIKAKRPEVDGRVRLDLEVYRSTGKLLDESNIWWGMSGFIDGFFGRRKIEGSKKMRRGLITLDDCPKYFHQGVILKQESDPKFKGRECVRFIITTLEQESNLWHGNEPSSK